MKHQTKKTKHTLADAGSAKALFLGLVTSEADYKISLLLNRVCEIELSSDKPVVSAITPEDKVSFSHFTSVSEFNNVGYQLISNKAKGKTLSKKYPGIDYILIINGTISKTSKEKIVSELRKNSLVTALFFLETESHINNNIVLQMP